MKPPQYYRTFDYDRSLLPNRHLASLETGVSGVDQAIERTGKTIGYPGWGVLYYLALATLKPNAENVIVETGTNVGCSSIVLAQALIDSGRPGTLFTIELDPDTHSRAVQNFEQAGVSNCVRAVLGDTMEELPKIVESLERDGQSIRIAFLDGSHLCEHALREFEMIHPLLEDDSLVLFDNTYAIAEDGEDPRVHGALARIRQHYGGNLVNLPFVSWFTPGLAVWQREPF